MGGGLKTAEFLSGRYADILSNLYMGYACLWYYQKNKQVTRARTLSLSLSLSHTHKHTHTLPEGRAGKAFSLSLFSLSLSCLSHTLTHSLPKDKHVMVARSLCHTHTLTTR